MTRRLKLSKRKRKFGNIENIADLVEKIYYQEPDLEMPDNIDNIDQEYASYLMNQPIMPVKFPSGRKNRQHIPAYIDILRRERRQLKKEFKELKQKIEEMEQEAKRARRFGKFY